MSTPLIPFLIALVVCFGVTPLVRRLSMAWGYLDMPVGGRKIHKDPVPFGGGVAILFAMAISITVAFSLRIGELADASWRFWGVVGLASVLLVLVGIWDDKVHLRGRHKLALQALIAVFVLAFGLQVDALEIFGRRISLGSTGGLFTLIWILGSVNAFNLIDGIDGVASLVGSVLGAALGMIALANGQTVEACVAFGLVGALIGFLPFNFAPASIFLGDAGSMLIGFILGVLAISGATKEVATVAAAPLLAIWAILILDSVAAFMRRILTGRSIYVGDRQHIHHRFLIGGLSVRQTALAVAGLCAVTSAAAVVSVWMRQESVGLIVAATTVLGLAAFRQFGHAEFKLLGQRLTDAGKAAIRPVVAGNGSIKSSVSLQGNTRWDDDWAALTEAAERYGLTELQLNLSIPALHENYYGAWRRREPVADREVLWSMTRPVQCRGEKIGAVAAKGLTDSCNDSSSLVSFLEFLEGLDGQIYARIGDLLHPAANPPVLSEFSAKDKNLVKAGVNGREKDIWPDA